MTFYPSIQALIATDSPGIGDKQSATAWAAGQTWQLGETNFGPGTLWQFNLNTGALINSQNVSAYPSANQNYPVALDANGVYITAGSFDVVQINPATLAEIQRVSTGIGTGQGMLTPITCTNGSTWLLVTGPGGPATFARVFTAICTSVTPMTIWGPGTLSFNNYNACSCAGAAGTGIGYVVSGDLASIDENIKIYKVNLNVGSQGATLLATHPATDFDAGWTDCGQGGVCLDQTDGNLLAVVYGSNSPKAYFVKFNATTGAIIWKIAMNDLYGSTGPNLAQSVIQSQQVVFVTSNSGTNTANIINTNSGTISSTFTTGLAGLVIGGAYAYNDQTGGLIGTWQFTSGMNAPTPLNSTPNSFTGWGVLYLVPGIVPPPSPGTPGGPATSRKRAWTYVLDGHTFYVIDLGAEGTYVYDTTTQTWAQWITDQYVQWDVANGVMWGNRIVGGDLATTTVWEVLGSTLSDNDETFDIPHVVTGGLVTRSREYQAVNALRLSISNGDLDDVAGTVMQLRFSDDQGHTWSPYFTLAVAEGDYSGEVNFLSLGSFAAPGRVFEISDLGGPLRIDGCDAFIADFDDDTPEEGGQK